MWRRLSRIGFILLVLAGLFSLKAPERARADTGNNWTGAFYNNRDLAGAPVFVRIDPAIVFNWGAQSPGLGIASSNWSARWQTVQYFNAGTYRFTVTADDGVRLSIDGRLFVDAWREQGPTTYTANIEIAAGNHALQVDYFQGIGDGSIAVAWDFISTASTAWTAQYFNNRDLAGGPVVTRFENRIDYAWGRGSPDPLIVADNFSARWTATLPFNAATYRFTLTGDDGVRLYIDGALIIDQWRIQSLTAFVLDVSLSAGPHTLRVEYFDGGDNATVRLNYQVAIGSPLPGADQWYGEYFANRDLQGSPSFVRLDGRSGINFDWSQAAPQAGFPRDNFSVRWTRNVFFPGRPYQFYLTVDDGARVWIDSTLIIDTWRQQSVTSTSKYVEITEGVHIVRVEYQQYSGGSLVQLTWDPPNSQTPPLPVGGINVPPVTGLTGAVTNANALNVRAGPGVIYDVVTRARRDDTFAVLARNADTSWLRVRLSSGLTGWLSTPFVTVNGNAQTAPVEAPPPPPPPKSSGVRARLYSGLKLRTAPTTNAPAIAVLEWGNVVDVIGRSADGEWYKVEYSGAQGWINGQTVLIIAGDILSVPVTAN